MKPGMRFLAATRVRSNNTNTTEGITNPATETGMYSPHSNYEMESRRYKNGRYAPRNGGERYYDIDIVRNEMRDEMMDEMRDDYGTSEMEMRGGRNRGRRGRSEMENEMEMNNRGRSEMEMERRNPVGFNARFESTGQSDASYNRMDNEMESKGGSKMEHGGAKGSGGSPKFNEKMAREWTSKMQNEDGTKGPHWSMSQVREVLEDRGITGETAKWWTVMNMMYSDYCKAAQKLGVNIMDFCVEMTKAFIHDKDAGAEDKVAAYYEHVVKG